MDLLGTKARSAREAESAQRREAAERRQREAVEATAAGYSWTQVASMFEPMAQHPTCDLCGAHVPIRNQGLHTEWHGSLSRQ